MQRRTYLLPRRLELQAILDPGHRCRTDTFHFFQIFDTLKRTVLLTIINNRLALFGPDAFQPVHQFVKGAVLILILSSSSSVLSALGAASGAGSATRLPCTGPALCVLPLGGVSPAPSFTLPPVIFFLASPQPALCYRRV